jgi:UDP-N-acetylglucosamine diphosphorylase / glucose-1-phosphate thymidylyltransferase / UDP-N-acetylgalactosamine diphosphorylase / glucosamine-1-phosphate N-acetyltransferase / galactosamine-1-phosphate N-acetyltransferase
MSNVLLYDDERARTFEPFSLTRPVSEMVAGVALIRERWRLALHASRAQFLANPRRAAFDEPGTRAAIGMIPAGTIIANSRCAPILPPDNAPLSPRAAACSIWRCGEQLAAVRIREAMDASVFADGTLVLDDLRPGTGSIGDTDGWWLNDVWDFIRLLPEQLASDVDRIAHLVTGPSPELHRPPDHAVVLGTHQVFVAQPVSSGTDVHTTVIEPHVIFDATNGPIFIGAGTHIRGFTRITGPCYIGNDVQIMGGDISGCSIGDMSKVRGELSGSIVIGHSNKGHDGFVGHSYLGRWVNLGAGTVTSNLKNTYGPVSLWTPDGIRDTGMQFLGTFFGDHVKTGIGLRLTTGTVIGAGANVYGSMPPKVVPPFSWGDAPNYETYRADKFIETATRAMSRRHVAMTDRYRQHMEIAHGERWSARGGDT